MFASILSAIFLRMRIVEFVRIVFATARLLALTILTITAVLSMAFVMNYSGATASLGLALAATGALFPFFGALLGWLGVFLTGSDTSANALFGNLQVVTANNLGLDPALMAAGPASQGDWVVERIQERRASDMESARTNPIFIWSSQSPVRTGRLEGAGRVGSGSTKQSQPCQNGGRGLAGPTDETKPILALMNNLPD